MAIFALMENMLSITPGQLPTSQLHSYLLAAVAPRPIAFASTLDALGRPNLSPYSFFNVFSSNPPVMIVSPNRRVRDNTTKHTLENVKATGELVVNVVSFDMVQQMSHDQAQEFLIEQHRLMLLQKTMYQEILRHEWKLDSDFAAR